MHSKQQGRAFAARFAVTLAKKIGIRREVKQELGFTNDVSNFATTKLPVTLLCADFTALGYTAPTVLQKLMILRAGSPFVDDKGVDKT